MEGRVRWFNPGKGYGFIEKSDGSGDVFFHFSKVKDGDPKGLEPGEIVTFEVAKGRKGTEAIDIARQNNDPAPGTPGEK